MRLRFLGAEYTRQWPSVEAQDGDVVGKYRGVTWSAKHHNAAMVATQPVTLHFLGRPYQAQV
ncbi:MAG: DUF4278 domain-containing protein [Leptolyngbyaceae cyanobacterium SM2_5_2]|nr:DUF4278 domain-containing protein [Leptolyngbyaceae cyanobacterium SM2_5_2]